MHLFVAFGTQRDQVSLRIAATLTAELPVVYLQPLHTAADLAAPRVPLQNPPKEIAICLVTEPQSRHFQPQVAHEGLPLISDKNAPC